MYIECSQKLKCRKFGNINTKGYQNSLKEDLKVFLNKFSLSNTQEIREQIRQAHVDKSSFNFKDDHDNDWILLTIVYLVRQYEADTFNCRHLESWYQSHISIIFENVYDGIDHLEAAE